MTSAAYGDTPLAAIYDALNPPAADDAFYRALAGSEPCRILDLGCGTGRLAVELAAAGHSVTGADPAASMLEIARQRPGGARVAWLESDAAGLATTARFDLAIMAGHVLQEFLEDTAIAGALASAARHLAPGGRLAFETRNPLARAWEGWTPAATLELVPLPGGGTVAVHYALIAVEGEFVSYETHFRFPGEAPRVATSRLRFPSQKHLAALLAEAGFRQVAWYGDWDRSPVGPASPELIAVARLA